MQGLSHPSWTIYLRPSFSHLPPSVEGQPSCNLLGHALNAQLTRRSTFYGLLGG